MKFRVISDVHNEFYNNGFGYRLAEHADDARSTLILAGDIGLLHRPATYENFIEDVCKRFKHVFWIEGNHEFYHGNISKHSVGNVIAQMKMKHSWNNIYTREMLIEDEKIAVVGCTLWTDFDNGNPLVMFEANSRMNDHRIIRKGDEYSKFYAENARSLHHVQKKKLFKDIEHYKNLGYKVIVVTHHHPSFKGVSPEYHDDSLNGAYCTDLTADIYDYEPDYWVCGHIHSHQIYSIGKTTVVCNPVGYSHEIGTNFNSQYSIII